MNKILLTFFLLFLPLKAEDDVFIIKDIKLDVTDTTATKARERAIESGKKQAWDKFLERTVPPSVREQFPQFSDNFIKEVVFDYSLSDEKNSRVRYLAKMTVRLRPSVIRKFMRAKNVPYAESKDSTTVVLPIFMTATKKMLWEEDNPWYKAWLDRHQDPFLTPILLPLNDLADNQDINLDQALAHDLPRLQLIQDRYHAKHILIAVARVNASSYDTPAIELSLAKISHNGSTSYENHTLKSAEGESVEHLLKRAANETIQLFESKWIEENRLEFDKTEHLKVVYEIEDLPNWAKMQKQLERVPHVQKVNIHSLSTTEGRLLLHYLGNPQKLQLIMPRHGIDLKEKEGLWYVSFSKHSTKTPLKKFDAEFKQNAKKVEKIKPPKEN